MEKIWSWRLLVSLLCIGLWFGFVTFVMVPTLVLGWTLLAIILILAFTSLVVVGCITMTVRY